MDENKKLNFSLSFMETKYLLEELEFCMGFKNRDITRAKSLYESIASELQSNPVVVNFGTPPKEK